MERLIAIGDIHGQSQPLLHLLSQIDPRAADQLVFLGDYVDRGSDSPGVLDELIAFAQRFPQTVFLRGNHEQMLLDALEVVKGRQGAGQHQADAWVAGRYPDAVSDFLACGGLETLSAYSAVAGDNPCAVLLAIPQLHLDFLCRTRYYYLCEPFLFVHAGVDPNDIRGEKNGPDPFLWQRQPLWNQDASWTLTVVHGHTPVAEPFFGPFEVNLDTGAGYGARLTACDLFSQKIWQVRSGRS